MLNLSISYSKFATSKSGGARESLLTLLNGVAESREVTVDVYQTPPIDDPPNTNYEYQLHTKRLFEVPHLTWTNQVVERFQWCRYLRSQLTSNHDILITQNALAPVSVQVAKELDIPSLFFVRSMALTGYEKYDPTRGHMSNLLQTDLGGRIQYPFLRKNFYDYKRAIGDATYTIANSEFTATRIKELFDVDATVIYPPIEPENYRVDYNEDGFITMVNPRAEYKGADIFLDIANELRDEDFLLVGPISSGTIRQRAERASNVTHWGWCKDMLKSYADSKLVVVPSRVEESFGRVPAEAMVSGIPCVVSDRGGLPEVVGDTGEIVEELDVIDRWLEAIERAFLDHDPTAQKRRAERFSATLQAKKLIEIIDEIRNTK